MEHEAILQVKRSIKKWPAYRKYAEAKGIDPLKISRLDELPVTGRAFIAQAIHTVPLFKVRSIVPSSGSTGLDFSYGLFSDTEMRKSSLAIESFLQGRFSTKKKKTLILNLLPGALSLWSTTATVAAIGVRMDTAVSMIQSLGSSFEQIILVGEPLFVKSLIEYGVQHAVSWEQLPLFIMVGGEWVPESYRNYIEGIVGCRRVFSSMGMAELGLHYFYETEETVMLRNLLFHDRDLLKAIFGEADFCPMLFAFDDSKIFVETIKEPDNAFEAILLTTVDPDRILPLLRCRCGDRGKILSIEQINRGLKAAGYNNLASDKLPAVLAHFGRGVGVRGLPIEEVKERLYASHELASASTGNFVLEDAGSLISLKIQMKEDCGISRVLEQACLIAFRGLPVWTELCPFELFPYPLDYERKVRYAGEGNYGGEREREAAELSA